MLILLLPYLDCKFSREKGCEGVTQFGEWALQVLEQGWFESGVHWKERLLEKRCYLLNMFSVT